MFSAQSLFPERGRPAQKAASGFDPDLRAVERAILQAVAYADVFDYPLTTAEVHRYLVGVSAPLETVRSILHNGWLVPHSLACCGDYFMLLGREEIVETRRSRATAAAHLWPCAVRYGRVIEALPFVYMVAVTGALAMDNVKPDSDIDYLIVTEPGRLWLCRALVIALVRLAALHGDVVCPNYFLSDRALVLTERNLFIAHELAQMVPIAGLATYYRMRQLNTWVDDFLPNAEGLPRPVATSTLHGRPVRILAETALRTPIGGWLERWEMSRKVRRFSQQRNDRAEATFCADWCKGHFDGHGQRILAAFADRLGAFERLTR